MMDNITQLFYAKHKKWTGKVTLQKDGTFLGGNGRKGNGTWTIDNDNLILDWYHWSPTVLKKDGNNYLSDDITLFHINNDLKISFCTTCKERLYHLQTTLYENLNCAKKYDNIEFVLLNYNSQDGLDEWVRKEMRDHINSGRLVYYKTEDPEYFHMSHAKNMAHRLSTGDILCNLDADNVISESFIDSIILEFSINNNIILKPNSNLKGNAGRITVSRDNFFKVRGYDEDAIGWGNEDQDFFNKCEINGCIPVLLKNAFSISHTDNERGKNYENSKIRQTSSRNANILKKKLKDGIFKSNTESSFGDGKVYKNFQNTIQTLEPLEYNFNNANLEYIFSNCELQNDEERRNIRFYSNPNIFLKEMSGNKINGMSSFWFEKGYWEMTENTLILDWFHRPKETLNKKGDNVYSNNLRNLIKVDE